MSRARNGLQGGWSITGQLHYMHDGMGKLFFFSLYRGMYYIDHKILKTSTKISVSRLLSPTCVYQRQLNVIAKMTTKGLGQVDKNDTF